MPLPPPVKIVFQPSTHLQERRSRDVTDCHPPEEGWHRLLSPGVLTITLNANPRKLGPAAHY
jgi:hypothetical protein